MGLMERLERAKMAKVASEKDQFMLKISIA